MRIRDRLGERRGRLEVISFAGLDSKGKAIWLCKCDCGKEVLIKSNHFNQPSYTGEWGCGCFRFQSISSRSSTHGESTRGRPTPEYATWISMRARCLNPNSNGYDDYGGRGITICKRWDSFENFLEDVGRKPSPKHSLDRFPNVNGNYCPENCRWATKIEQARNTRRTHLIEYLGEEKCISEWAEIFKITPQIITGRLKLGWTVKDALEIPRGQSRPIRVSAIDCTIEIVDGRLVRKVKEE